MQPTLAWLDFNSAERERTQRVLALFEERDTRDELGLGGIRDSFADHFFPGTSTIQTRLRYLFFISLDPRLAVERGKLMRQDRKERDQEALMRDLDRDWERGLTPWVEMRRWRRRFWFAVALAVVLAIALLWQRFG